MKSGNLLYYSLSALLGVFLCSSAVAAHQSKKGISYVPRLTVGGLLSRFHDQHGLEAEAWIPLHQDTQHVLFVDVRGLKRHNGRREANLVLGYRCMPVKDILFGLYMSFDPVRSGVTHHTFHQITLGGESWIGSWFLGANAYIPLGKSQQDTPAPSLSLSPAYLDRPNYRLIYCYTNHEYFLGGFDATVGLEPWKGLVLKVGGFLFKNNDISDLSGPQVQIRYTFYNDASFLLNRVSATAGYRYDRVRGSDYHLGLHVALGFRHQVHLSRMEQHMVDHPDRDLDGVITSSYTPVETLKNDDGTDWIVALVNTPQDFYNAYNDTIYRVRTLAVSGTLSDFDHQQLVPEPDRALPFNITGGNIRATFCGQPFSLQVADQGVLQARTGQPLFSGQSNLTHVFSDIILQVDPGQDVFVQTGPFTASFDHVTAEGGLAFTLATGQTGILTLTQSTFQSTSGHGLELTSGSAGTLNITEMTNVTLSGRSNTSQGYGLGNLGTGHIKGGSITHSTILGEGISNALDLPGGIGLFNQAGGILEFGPISYSMIQGVGLEPADGVNYSIVAHGIDNQGSGIIRLGLLSDSVITAESSIPSTSLYLTAYGIENSGTLDMVGLSNSTISSHAVGELVGHALGIRNHVNAVLHLGYLSGSEVMGIAAITFLGGSHNFESANAFGIGVTNSGIMTITDLSDSTIAGQATSGGVSDSVAISNNYGAALTIGSLTRSSIRATSTSLSTDLLGHSSTYGIFSEGALNIGDLLDHSSIIATAIAPTVQIDSMGIYSASMSLGNLSTSVIRGTAEGSHAMNVGIGVKSFNSNSVLLFGDLTGGHFEGTTASINNLGGSSIQGYNITQATYSPNLPLPEIIERTP